MTHSFLHSRLSFLLLFPLLLLLRASAVRRKSQFNIYSCENGFNLFIVGAAEIRICSFCIGVCVKCLYRLLNTIKYYCAIAHFFSLSLCRSPFYRSPTISHFICRLSIFQSHKHSRICAHCTLVVLQPFIGLLKCILVSIERWSIFRIAEHCSRGLLLLLSQATSSPINCRCFYSKWNK